MLGLIVAGILSLGTFAGETGAADCSGAPPAPSVELVYRLQRSVGTPEQTLGEAAGVLCERLRAFQVAGQVTAVGAGEIQVLLPPMEASVATRLAERLGARGHLAFYDWEANLIGPERLVGGRPGLQPPTRALRRAEREWRVAGRNPDRIANRLLLLAGAFPGAHGAVRLASEQVPRSRCALCAASGPRFYLFDRSPRHRLLAGPAGTRAALFAAAKGKAGIVLKVPLGTTIVHEHPYDQRGRVRDDVAPGWYALRDRPALTGADIVDPAQEFDPTTNAPTVTFGFTRRGRTAFHRVTRAIAQRGQAQALGPVTREQAEGLSHHFAIALDGEVASRPIINFAENPDGIDGRTGAQISGGFATVKEARELATTMRIGALPVELELVRLTRRRG